MSKYHYKNSTDTDIAIINIGIVKAGATLDSDVLIENPNLELVADAEAPTKQTVSKEKQNVSGN